MNVIWIMVMVHFSLLVGVLVLLGTSASAKFYDLHREAVINTTATKVALRCSNRRSLFRKCFPHISKGQCQNAMRIVLPRCKEEIFRFARRIGKANEPAKTQRKAIKSLMEGCIIVNYRDRLARDEHKTMACMIKVRH